MSQLHDHFFKAALQLPGAPRDLLLNALPAADLALLDIDRVEVIPTERIGPELASRRLDAFFRVPRRDGDDAYIFAIVDHKRRTDRWFALQCLDYIVSGWRMARLDSPSALYLPAIVGIAVCHDSKPWGAPRDMHSLVQVAGLGRYVPQFQYALLDLSLKPDDEMTGQDDWVAAMMALKYVFRTEVHERLPAILQRCGEQSLNPTLKYLVNACPELSLEEVMDTLAAVKKEKNAMPTIADTLRAEGHAAGRIHAERSLTRRLLTHRFGAVPSAVDARLEQLGEAQLENLAVSLLDFKGVDDLIAWLDREAG